MLSSDAAQNLKGRTLKNGWKVLEKLEKKKEETGGCFSVCYKVRRATSNGFEECFLKVYDFGAFFSMESNEPIIDILNNMTNAYIYERDISKACEDHYVKNVLLVKEAAEEIVEGFSPNKILYLIFDLAQSDVRRKMSCNDNSDIFWRFKSLHSVTTGLQQLHRIQISHQDLKPSNVLVFNDGDKIGDLGRSQSLIHNSPYNESKYSGDKSYRPPEISYHYYLDDWLNRSYATDLYLLGSLVVFYFSCTTMNALLKKHLSEEHWHRRWGGSFEEVKPYLLDAYYKSIDEFKHEVETLIPEDDIVVKLVEIVSQLCNIDPHKRGHPKNLFNSTHQYSLERYVSDFNLLFLKAKYLMR